MTHPFHPWSGREFQFVVVQRTWKTDRVFFFDGNGALQSLPRSWTDAADPDPFVSLSAGRSTFRVEDLLTLAEIIDGLGDPDEASL